MPNSILVRSAIALWCVVLPAVAMAEQPSQADCAAEADRATRDVGSGLGGVAGGAAKGAIFGAIVGDKKSAKKGAALGGLIGGVRRGAEKNDVYKSVYDACMRRR